MVERVKSFRKKHRIDILYMGAPYTAGQGRSRYRKDPITMENYFRVDIFYVTRDSQLQ